MDREFLDQAAALLKQHEGIGFRPYLDSRGNWTLGYGRNLEAKGLTGKEFSVVLTNPITVTQAEYLLDNDIIATLTWLSTYKWWTGLTNSRKLAMLDMGFNLGQSGFEHFTHMISALESGDYTEVAKQMRTSLWFTQVGQRAKDDLMLMLKG